MKKGIDYIGVTVCFYCHDGKGNLLLQKRSKNCRDEQGRWDCGGGSMKFGETFEETVLREIREEYCSTPKQMDFAGVSNVVRSDGQTKSHWVALIFTVLLDPIEVKLGDADKMEKIGWFHIDSLPAPLHSMYLTHLEYAKKFFK